jgi:hypothetical protein
MALLGATWALGGRGGAAELTDWSWWWFGNQGPVPVLGPPTVPEGGLYVAGAPDGAKAIAAVRFGLAEGESNPVLTLTVAENGDQGGDGAVLGACVAGSAWGGGENGGPWEAKPNAACASGSVQGIRSEDGTSWTFGLAPLVVAGEVNVVITPGTIAPDAPAGSTFSLAFNPPTSAALVTTSGSGSSGDAESFAAPSDLAVDLSSDAVSGFDAAGDLGGVNAFEPSLPEASQGLTSTAPLVRQTTAGNALPRATPASAGGSALAFLVLLTAAAVMVRLNKVAVPGLRRLGPGAAGAAPVSPVLTTTFGTGGLGRFSRPRTGTPPPLS